MFFIENDSHFVFGLSPGGYRAQWRCAAHAMLDTMTRADGNAHNAENSYARDVMVTNRRSVFGQAGN